jgi:hypothetical protein
MQALGIALLIVGIVASVKQRCYMSMWRSQTTDSPVSRALAHLVGTAGGIYLSLELLFSFLKLPQEWWNRSSFAVEPLALISLIVAIIQPFGLRLWFRLKK